MIQDKRAGSVVRRALGRRGAPSRARRPSLEGLEARALLAVVPGTFTSLTNPMPDSGAGTNGGMMLLPDGSVIVEDNGTGAAGLEWYRLTPDGSGNYADGTWTALPPMHLARSDASSVVLPDGRVMVLGGEDSGPNLKRTETNECEIYDPVANTWTVVAPVPANPKTGITDFGDEPSEVLPDGTVLTTDGSGYSFTYNPATNTWSSGLAMPNGDQGAEENWAKLPDGSVLAVPIGSEDIFTSEKSNDLTAERYIPATSTTAGHWIDAGTLPVDIAVTPAPSVGGWNVEEGPMVALPDGRLWIVGGSTNTALYSPATNTWTAGPTIPKEGGQTLVGGDSPAAVLPDGNVLYSAAPFLATPASYFEFDPTANGGKGSFTLVGTDATISDQDNTFLDLPNGQVLIGSTGWTTLKLYTTAATDGQAGNGQPEAAWRPSVSAVTPQPDGTYLLTGTQLNGLSEGAYYGDDEEMSSNFPLVELKAAAGLVSFATTSDWSSTGFPSGVPMSAKLALPAGLPAGSYTLTVVANGIASAGVAFTYAGHGLLPTTPGSAPFGSPAPATSGATPTTNLAAAEATGLYQTILGRAPDPAGLAAAESFLNGGGSVAALAGSLLGSAEYDSDLVSSYYQTFLHRAASSAEVSAWDAAIQKGLTPYQVAVDFLTSSEFNADEPSNASFIQALYGDVLGRVGSSSEVSAWVAAMASGTTRAQAVADFLGSTEGLTRVVDGLYASILGRAADAGGLGASLALLEKSPNYAQVAINLFGSAEFAHRAGTAG